MKMLILVLAICVTVAFSVQPLEIGESTSGGYNPVPTDDLVFAQTYIHDDSLHGWAWGQICDDFELTSYAAVDKVVIWACTVDLETPPNPIPPLDYCDFAILQDNGDEDPNTATPVWSGTSTTTYIDTGDAFNAGTLPIYELTCTLSSTANLTAGVRYWFVVTQYYIEDDLRFYSCVTAMLPIIFTESWINNGDIPWETGSSTFGYVANMYFDLYGTLGALDNSTWGNIKSVF